jgi:hypothetical protein
VHLRILSEKDALQVLFPDQSDSESEEAKITITSLHQSNDFDHSKNNSTLFVSKRNKDLV